MLKTQRQQMIIDYLEVHQFAKVEDLAALTGSTGITTRRDINELSERGLIEKVHGGAQKLEVQKHDVEVKYRMENLKTEKHLIAQKAIEFIKPGSTVYLDAGTSTHYLIPMLKAKDVKVITHGVHHVEALSVLGIDTLLIGGHIKKETLASVGSFTLEAISKLHFDIAFMGTNAIDSDFGFSTPDQEEALIKAKIIEQASDVYVLADASKFGRKSHVQFAEPGLTIITDFKETELYPNYKIIQI